MKRKSPRKTGPKPPPPPESSPPPAAPTAPGRRRLFRLLAVLAVPALVLVAELALRVAGYGYPPGFFQETQRNGKAVIIPNERFGLRFFPARLARSPTPWVMDAVKPAGTIRIFLFGESAALGDPRPAYGMGRYLRALLQERHPEAQFEVIPVAMTAINSHALREAAWDARRYEADFWVIYMGNNEMAGPFGAVSMFDARAPSLAWIRTLLAIKSTRLGQAAARLADSWLESRSRPSAWRGLGMFSGQSLAPNDPARTRVHNHFRANLRSMLTAATGHGIPVLVCTVASNLRDCAPFASQNDPSLAQETKERWEKLVAAGVADQAAGRPAEALANFAEARRLDERHAALHFQEGRSSLAINQVGPAQERLTSARDLDALPFRADSAINRIAAEGVEEYRDRGAGLVDVERSLAATEVPGQELFFDHVHFTFDGNDRVAREIAVAIESRLPEKVRKAAGPDWAAQETIEARLAMTDWNRHGAYEAMFQRCQGAPFTNQLNHVEHLIALRSRMLECRERLHPRQWLDAGDIYREAIAKSPGDPLLYEAQAEFLEATRQPAEALAAWRKVVELMPNHPAAWFNTGRLLAREGRFGEARSAFNECLAARPGEVEVLLELGRMLTLQTNHAEALAMFENLRRQFPDDPRVLRHLADPLAAVGRRAEAVDCLRQAVQLSPGYWEARYLLGVELAVDGKLLDAGREFEAVLRLRPDHTLARLNIGVTLVRLGQAEAARQQFNEVLRQEPQNARARQHLDTLEKLLHNLTNAPPKTPAQP